MNDLLNIVNKIRINTEKLSNNLATKYSISYTEFPICGLVYCNQQSIIVLELLSHYINIWSKISPNDVDNPKETIQENAERLMNTTKAMFILSMSGFEFAAKKSILKLPSKIILNRGRIYLKKIINESLNVGLITSLQENLWEGAIQTRNILVHNNGISDINCNYSYPNGLKINFVKDKMLRGNLLFFSELTYWTVTAYSEWCDEFLK